MDTRFKTLLLTTVLAGAATAAQAQGNTAPPGGGADPSNASSPHQRAATGSSTLKMAMQDGAVPATFVKKAVIDSMAEVELGQAALAKSQDEKVRKFAQRMVTDHGKANAELASIAKQKGLDVPTSLDAEHQSLIQMLNSKSGAAFDAAYSEHMNSDHSKAVALFEGASKGTDADLARFAKKTLPTLEEHKKMAEGLAGAKSAKHE